MPLLAGLAALLVAAALVLWIVSAPATKLPEGASAESMAARASAGETASETTASSSAVTGSLTTPIGGSASAAEADRVVGQILAENPTVEGGRARLLESFSKFNDLEKIAATPHLVNLVEDEGIVGLVNVLHDPATPTEAKELIFDNMLNRPPQVGWPVLLGVMAAPGHPLAQKARETLTIVIGSEYGDRMDEWSKALEAQLTRQKQ